MRKVDLCHAAWELENPRIGVVKATVPGCVHTDLAANGHLPDVMYRDNSDLAQWIETENWTYRCRFTAESASCVSLVFEGLDTYADVLLNGVSVGDADNMFIEQEFDVSSVLQNGENVLEVRFRSPITEVENRPPYPAIFTAERVHTRRIQCTYGWDWVARFVTCGIYRPVYLKYEDGISVRDVYVSTDSLDALGAQLYCEVECEHSDTGGIVSLELFSPDGERIADCEFYTSEAITVRRFDVEHPQLWYPAGYGEQPLYTLVAKTKTSEYTRRFGIRTVKIVQLEDKAGSEYYRQSLKVQQSPLGKIYDKNERFSGFQVVINGEKIFCKGANWVPCEPFPSAETPQKFKDLLEKARAMNLNFLRVWGGGIFENDVFYDLCDEYGIMVAQDFLMACAHYPEKEEWFLNALRKETRHAAKKLRNHPCLMWWHGDNENALHGSDAQEDYTGRNSALKGMADTLRQLDRMRRFLPSSPYGGNTYASLTCGTSHTTNYCGELFKWCVNTDGSDYKEFFSGFLSRFVSEEPILGMASTYTLLKTMTAEDIFGDNEDMLRYHTKDNPESPIAIYAAGRTLAERVLGVFADGHDRLFKCQYLQYEWVRVVFENIRRHMGYCNGLVFWMFDDCWAASFGWSLLDYYGIPKSGYYAFKRCAQPITLSVIAEDGGYAVSVTNDTNTAAHINLTAYRLDLKNGGQVTAQCALYVQVADYGVAKETLPWAHDENTLIVCEGECNGVYDRSFYKDGALPIRLCNEAVSVVSLTDTAVTVKANRYVHAVGLDGNAVFADNYFSLLKDEVREIAFTPKEQDPAVTCRPYVPV